MNTRVLVRRVQGEHHQDYYENKGSDQQPDQSSHSLFPQVTCRLGLVQRLEQVAKTDIFYDRVVLRQAVLQNIEVPLSKQTNRDNRFVRHIEAFQIILLLDSERLSGAHGSAHARLFTKLATN